VTSVYLHTWRCCRCEVTWRRDGGLSPCWYCGRDDYVWPSVDECLQGGVLSLPPARPPSRGGPQANLVIVDELHEWPPEVLELLETAMNARDGHG
jgi:hypothetical protein